MLSRGLPVPFDRYLVTFFVDGVGRLGSTQAGTGIDWNGNGFIGDAGVMADINASGELESEMRGAEDWGHLKYAFQCYADFAD